VAQLVEIIDKCHLFVLSCILPLLITSPSREITRPLTLFHTESDGSRAGWGGRGRTLKGMNWPLNLWHMITQSSYGEVLSMANC